MGGCEGEDAIVWDFKFEFEEVGDVVDIADTSTEISVGTSVGEVVVNAYE